MRNFFDWSAGILVGAGLFLMGALAQYATYGAPTDPIATPAAATADGRLVVGLSEVIAAQQAKIRDLEHDCKLMWGIIQEATKNAPSVRPSGPCISADTPELEEMEITP